MTKLFGVDIAKELAAGMAAGLLPAKLTRNTPGTRDPSDITAGTRPTSKTYACRGFLDDYSDRDFDGTDVIRGDRKALILGATLPAGVFPHGGDLLTIEGKTFNLVGVPQRDPAAATYLCQLRGGA